MGFFTDKCKECKATENVQMCQFCRKMVCQTCLHRLAYRDDTPKWFVGKKVHNFEEYKQVNLEYCKLIKSKGGHIHLLRTRLEGYIASQCRG